MLTFVVGESAEWMNQIAGVLLALHCPRAQFLAKTLDDLRNQKPGSGQVIIDDLVKIGSDIPNAFVSDIGLVPYMPMIVSDLAKAGVAVKVIHALRSDKPSELYPSIVSFLVDFKGEVYLVEYDKAINRRSRAAKAIAAFMGVEYRNEAKGQIKDEFKLAESRSEQAAPPNRFDLSRHEDPLVVTSAARETTNVFRNFLKGCPTFLVCGGPSAKSLNLDWLNRRGIWSIAVNNMAAHFKPNAFVCSDPPSKFHNAIWMDPSIMKLVPIPKLGTRRGLIRQKVDGKFEPLILDGKMISTADCPNVWGFSRHGVWDYTDSFFLTESAAWGNANAGVMQNGLPKVLCTMLLAIRLLYYFGSRRIYLVGVDFHMTKEAGYAFGQSRTDHNSHGNNTQYAIINDGLCQMVENGVFQRFGLEIFNCYQNSALRAFPYVPFDSAYLDAVKDFPKDMDLEGWYEKPGSTEDDRSCDGESAAGAALPVHG